MTRLHNGGWEGVQEKTAERERERASKNEDNSIYVPFYIYIIAMMTPARDSGFCSGPSGGGGSTH